MTTLLANQEIELLPPESVKCGTNTTRCGGTVYRGLACLLAHGPEGTDMTAVCNSVWGKPGVKAETLRSLIWRVNNLMRGLGSSRRAMLAEGRVLFE